MTKAFTLYRQLILFTCFLLFAQTAYPVYFRKLVMEEGLSHFSVLSIYQDIHGRMWFGTNEGLSIYDGRQMKIYKPSDASDRTAAIGNLAGNQITTITADKEGNVFLLADKSLVRYDVKKQHFDVIRKKTVRALTSYGGEIWCTSNDSIFTFDATAGALTFQLKTNLQDINRLLVDSGRAVEFAGEGIRFSDIRRWRTAVDVCSKPKKSIHGVLRYNARFIDRDYLWPIPATEREINKKLEQNQSW